MTYEERLVKWAKMWHGDCPDDCDIKEALGKYDDGDLYIAELLEVINETDDGWIESFFKLEEGSESCIL